jgi:hypothetical protein
LSRWARSRSALIPGPADYFRMHPRPSVAKMLPASPARFPPTFRSPWSRGGPPVREGRASPVGWQRYTVAAGRTVVLLASRAQRAPHAGPSVARPPDTGRSRTLPPPDGEGVSHG